MAWRRKPKSTWAVALSVALAVAWPTGAAAAARDTPRKDWGNPQVSADGQSYEFNARTAEDRRRTNETVRAEEKLENFRRAPRCNVAGPVPTTPLNGDCPPAEGTVGLNNCGEDTPLEPLWRQVRADVNSPWSVWHLFNDGGCAADILPVMTQEDFRRLPLPAPVLTLQPDRGWVLINIETIVRTDPTPVTLRTDLLGYGVTVEATPTRWTYDFGDGHTLTTTSPGHPYPDHDVFHEYEQPGQAAITLTAQWTGRYQIDGNPTWRDINGTATTTTTSPPFDIEERTSRLVSGPCTDIPTPPDC